MSDKIVHVSQISKADGIVPAGMPDGLIAVPNPYAMKEKQLIRRDVNPPKMHNIDMKVTDA